MQIKTIFETNDALKNKEKSKEKILQIIANNPYVTTRELSELVGLKYCRHRKKYAPDERKRAYLPYWAGQRRVLGSFRDLRRRIWGKGLIFLNIM